MCLPTSDVSGADIVAEGVCSEEILPAGRLPADALAIVNYKKLLNIDDMNYDERIFDKKAIVNILKEAYIENSRIILPALWEKKFIKFLPQNYKLALNVLNSNYKKYSKDLIKLKEYDTVIQDEISKGILES